MNSTRKVIFLTIGAVALETFAGVALASELAEVVGRTMETAVGVLGTALLMCLLIIGTGVYGVRKLLRAIKEDDLPPEMKAFVGLLKDDTANFPPEATAALAEIQKQVKILVEQSAMRRAEQAGPKAGRPYLD